LVELFCQLEIFLSQSSGVMSCQPEGHFIPANIDVGVMPRFLSESRDDFDELDRSRKILELKGARDGLPLFLPVGDGSEGGLDLSGTQFFHAVLVTEEARRVTPKTMGAAGAEAA